MCLDPSVGQILTTTLMKALKLSDNVKLIGIFGCEKLTGLCSLFCFIFQFLFMANAPNKTVIVETPNPSVSQQLYSTGTKRHTLVGKLH